MFHICAIPPHDVSKSQFYFFRYHKYIYEGGNMVKVTSLVKHDEDVQTDVRTARIVQQIANSISDYIQVEID